MQQINIAPEITLRDDRPQVTAHLRIDGVAPALRPFVPESMPIPPEPQPKEPSFGELAAKQRAALLNDKEFVQKYQAGHVDCDRIIKTLIRIEMSKGVSEEALRPLAASILLEKPRPIPDAPKVNPYEHVGTSADYKLTAVVSPEDRTSATEFAAALRFRPVLGNAVLDRIAEVERKVNALPLFEYEKWLGDQERLLGSPEEAKALRDDARRALTELGGGHSWSKIDAASLQDAWVIRTLATRWRSHVQAK